MIRRCLLVLTCLFAFFAVDCASPATAQTAPTGQSSALPPAQQNSFYAWVSAKQADYNKRLASLIREIRTGDPVVATALLAVLSFVYGVLHAAGPGHGKAIISSYVLANERTVRRGIALSFLAALFQALSAIILVGVLIFVFNASGVARQTTEAWLESISWGLVALLGAWFLFSQIRKLLAQRSAGSDLGLQQPGHHHGDAHHHGHAGAQAQHHHAGHHGHNHHHHDHHHHHHHGDHSDCCGHAHMPDPKQLEGEWSWSKALALALAVGIRPCTGAIFVLSFALSQGLLWAGIFATFAMALGTAITVSVLAALAVGSREFAARFGGDGSGWGGTVRAAAGIAGSFAVMVMGIVLFLGSLGPGSAF